MLWLIGQVWLLCAMAFLAGAGTTWLVFVRPVRSLPPTILPGPMGMAPWSEPSRPARPATPAPVEQPLPPPVDPALAILDREREIARHRREIGAAAAAALDALGVAPAPRAPDAERPGPDGSARGTDDTRAEPPRRPHRATTPAEIPAQVGPGEMTPP